MKRAVLVAASIGVVALLAVALVITLIISPGRSPVNRRTALAAYLDYEAEVQGRAWRVVEEHRAARPDLFTAELSGVTYGDAVHYDVAVPYPGTDITPTEPLLGVPLGRFAHPIPYPPEEVWCVRLAQEGTEAPAQSVVFVARHQDLYNASWIVHRALSLTAGAAPSDTWTTLGCGAYAQNP